MTLKEVLKQYDKIVKHYSRATGLSLEESRELLKPHILKNFGSKFKTLEKKLK